MVRFLTTIRKISDLRRAKGRLYDDVLKYLPKFQSKFRYSQKRIFMALLLGPHMRLAFYRRGTRTQFFYERPSSEIAEIRHIWFKLRSLFSEGDEFFLYRYRFSTLATRELWVGFSSPPMPSNIFKFFRGRNYFTYISESNSAISGLPQALTNRTLPFSVIAYAILDSGCTYIKTGKSGTQYRFFEVTLQLSPEDLKRLVGFWSEQFAFVKVFPTDSRNFLRPARGVFSTIRFSVRHNDWEFFILRHLPDFFTKSLFSSK